MFVDVYKDNKRKQEVYLIYVDLYSVRESKMCCGLMDESLLTPMVTCGNVQRWPLRSWYVIIREVEDKVLRR